VAQADVVVEVGDGIRSVCSLEGDERILVPRLVVRLSADHELSLCTRDVAGRRSGCARFACVRNPCEWADGNRSERDEPALPAFASPNSVGVRHGWCARVSKDHATTNTP